MRQRLTLFVSVLALDAAAALVVGVAVARRELRALARPRPRRKMPWAVVIDRAGRIVLTVHERVSAAGMSRELAAMAPDES